MYGMDRKILRIVAKCRDKLIIRNIIKTIRILSHLMKNDWLLSREQRLSCHAGVDKLKCTEVKVMTAAVFFLGGRVSRCRTEKQRLLSA